MTYQSNLMSSGVGGTMTCDEAGRVEVTIASGWGGLEEHGSAPWAAC